MGEGKKKKSSKCKLSRNKAPAQIIWLLNKMGEFRQRDHRGVAWFDTKPIYCTASREFKYCQIYLTQLIM